MDVHGGIPCRSGVGWIRDWVVCWTLTRRTRVYGLSFSKGFSRDREMLFRTVALPGMRESRHLGGGNVEILVVVAVVVTVHSYIV